MPRAKSRAPTTLQLAVRNGIGIVTLDRPELHNAFNEVVIAELTQAARDMGADDAVRAVILNANGTSFCAGADLNWMKKMAGYSRAQNVADAAGLAQMLKALNELPKPTVARVHGAAYGGGVGLVACCDIAIAAAEATFSLSESKLGLIPATISPYVIEAIGARQARRYFLTAERFEAAEAYRLGLVHDIVPMAQLDDRVNETLGPLLVAGPAAQRECKALIRAVAHRPIDDKLIADTVQRIASVRASPEGKEGVAAFLGKRPANWVPEALRRK
ncbi:MAG: enoyl-CoA hydratase/isomerase family protein [Burkholderiales bacterium]|nr:enoyl-CoA hydratase/isomerase family protein [Burkholderiales bacterium]